MQIYVTSSAITCLMEGQISQASDQGLRHLSLMNIYSEHFYYFLCSLVNNQIYYHKCVKTADLGGHCLFPDDVTYISDFLIGQELPGTQRRRLCCRWYLQIQIGKWAVGSTYSYVLATERYLHIQMGDWAAGTLSSMKEQPTVMRVEPPTPCSS